MHSCEGNVFRLLLEKWLTFRKSEVASFCVALLYALVISGYAFIANIPILLDIQSRLFGISLRTLILLLSLAIILLLGIKRRKLYAGPLWLPLSIFWVLYIGKIGLDTLVIQAPRSHPGIEYYAFSIGSCLIPMLAFMVYQDVKTIRRAFKAILSVSATAVLLLLMNILVIKVDANYWEEMGRLGVTVLNPISIGHLAATLTILSGFALTGCVSTSRKEKSFAFVFVMLGMATLILAASKGPILALIIVGLAMVWMVSGSKRWGIGRLLSNGVLIVVVVWVPWIFALNHGSSMLHRLSMLSAGSDAGVYTRIEMLIRAWEQFLKSPLLGGALELEGYSSYPHNVLLESFMATGIIGGLAFTILILVSTWRAFRVIRRNNQYSWVGLLYLQYMVGALVSGALAFSATMWSLMGAVIAVSCITLNREVVSSSYYR